jgi:hypothetical protein
MANRTIKMSKLKRAFQMLSAKRPQREICEFISASGSPLSLHSYFIEPVGAEVLLFKG